MKVNMLLKLAVFAAATGFATAYAAEPITWTIGTIHTVGSSYDMNANKIPERIEKATNGRLKIKLYDTLVKGTDQPGAVKRGELDGSFAVNPWISTEAPILNIGTLPGLITTTGFYKKVLDGFLRDEMVKIWDSKYNSKMLNTGVFEINCVFSKGPITKVGDFAGKKIRVHNNAAADLIMNVKAVPTNVDFGEIVPAMQRGIVDAIMTSAGTATGMHIYDVADNINMWDIGTIISWSFIINNDKWDELPDDLKPIVAEEFKKLEEEHYANIDEYNKQLIKGLEAKGMVVNNISPDELSKLFSQDNTKSVYDNWYKLAKDNVDKAKELVTKIEEMKASTGES